MSQNECRHYFCFGHFDVRPVFNTASKKVIADAINGNNSFDHGSLPICYALTTNSLGVGGLFFQKLVLVSYKQLGFKKTPLTEGEKSQLATLTKKSRLTVREKNDLIRLLKTKLLTDEEKKCFADLGIIDNGKPRLPESAIKALIKFDESQSTPLKKEEKEYLTHLLENRSLTEEEVTQLSQLNIHSEKSLTKEEQDYLTELVNVIAKLAFFKDEKFDSSVSQDEIMPDFYTDKQVFRAEENLASSISMEEQSEYLDSSFSREEEESLDFSVLKEGIAQNFCTEEQKEALQKLFEQHYATAVAYSLGLID